MGKSLFQKMWFFRFVSQNLSKLEDKVIEELSHLQLTELLDGEHPVDVTESELLQIVVKWLSFNNGSGK